MTDNPTKGETDVRAKGGGRPAVGVVEWNLPEDAEDLAMGVMAEIAPQGFEVSDASTLGGAKEGHVLLRAYMSVEDAEDRARSLVSAAADLVAAGALAAPGSIVARSVEQVDWAEEVRKGFTALDVGRFHIRPPWDEAGREARSGDIGRTADTGDSLGLVILPGAAFGTGRHPTTRLCLLALEELAGKELAPGTLLDLGAGSGLLALAAAKLWPGAQVTASEPDPDALDSCRDNVRLNGLESRIELLSDTSLAGRTFDLVVANIRLNTLLGYADAFSDWVLPGGWLILSGLLESETETMLESLRGTGRWDLDDLTREDEWRCLVLRAEDR